MRQLSRQDTSRTRNRILKFRLVADRVAADAEAVLTQGRDRQSDREASLFWSYATGSRSPSFSSCGGDLYNLIVSMIVQSWMSKTLPCELRHLLLGRFQHLQSMRAPCHSRSEVVTLLKSVCLVIDGSSCPCYSHHIFLAPL